MGNGPSSETPKPKMPATTASEESRVNTDTFTKKNEKEKRQIQSEMDLDVESAANKRARLEDSSIAANNAVKKSHPVTPHSNQKSSTGTSNVSMNTKSDSKEKELTSGGTKSDKTETSFESTAPMTTTTAAARPSLPRNMTGLGLVRIPFSEATVLPKSLSVPSGETVYELTHDAILGRNAAAMNAASSAGGETKLNLDIGPDATGVSRKQLKIKSIHLNTSPPSISLESFPKTPNAVAIHRLTASKTAEILPKGATTSLLLGDVLIMDEYRNADDRLLEKPAHVFRLVAMTEEEETSSSSSSEEEEKQDEKETAAATPHGQDTEEFKVVQLDDKEENGEAAAEAEGVPHLRIPEVGDFFRAVFGHDPKEPFHGRFNRNDAEYYYGKAVKVSNKGDNEWNVSLKFDDDNNTYDYQYPSEDIEILMTSHDHKKFYTGDDELTKNLVYDKDPHDLYPGDAVEAFTQNGLYEDRKWWRGRVMTVNAKAGTCEIVYDDGECEVGIPMRKEKVRLLERGFENLSWLEKATVPFLEGNKRGVITKMGRYDDCDSGYSKTRIKVVSKEEYEVQTYEQVVTTLLGDVRKKASEGKGLLEWPTGGKNSKKPAAKKSTASKRTDQGSAPKAGSKRKKGAAKQQEEKTAAKKSCGRKTTEEIQWEAPEDVLLGLTNAAKTAAKKKFAEEEQSFYNEKPHEALLTHATSLRPTLANAATRALNSAQPHIGTELFLHHAFVDGKLPPVTHMKRLFDMMKLGPQSKGTFYPDPSKMAMVADLVMQLVQEAGLSNNVVASTPTSWSELESYLQQVEAKIYCSPEDFSSSSAASLARVGQSLHVMACGIELTEALFRVQLDSVMRDRQAVSSKEYRDMPIVKAFRDQGRRHARDSLKFTANALAKAWMNFGHFVLNDQLDSALVGEEPAASLQRCTYEAARLIDALGSVCCFAAWIYCAEQDVAIDSEDVALLVSNAIRNGLDLLEVDLCPFVGSKGETENFKNFYWKRSMFHLVRVLKQPFVKPLQFNVAKMLAVQDELLFVTSCCK